MTRDETRVFTKRWLPAWTGNRPGALLAFCAKNAFYLDPGVPDGIRDRPALHTYFIKLRAHNPDWIWTQIEGIPMEGGFLKEMTP